MLVRSSTPARALHGELQVALVGLQRMVVVLHRAIQAGQHIQVAMHQVVSVRTVGLRHQVDGQFHTVDALVAATLIEEVLAHRHMCQRLIIVVARLFGQVEQLLQPLMLLDLVAGEFAGATKGAQHAQSLLVIVLHLLVIQ